MRACWCKRGLAAGLCLWQTCGSPRRRGSSVAALAVSAAPLDTPSRRPSRVDLQAAVGQVIDGDFELVRAIGSGSHADVFLAKQKSVGNRQVAVKALSYLYLKLPERDIKKAGQALQREAELLGRMRSPCYVDIYRCGAMADGRPYIAMQLAEGMTLQQIMAGLNASAKRMTEDRVAEVIGQWANGLSELHALGWIHRDVSPANAAVCDNANGVMHLLTYDLGTATQPVDKADRFRIGWDKDNPAGTPAYMPPEQARGDVVDSRADQFSLACIAYELLTGVRAVAAGATRASEALELLRSTQQIPQQTLASLRPDLHPSVSEVVHRALAREPAQRFDDALGFAQALTTALHQAPGEGSNLWSRLWRRGGAR